MKLYNDNYLFLISDLIIRSQKGPFMQFFLATNDIQAYSDSILLNSDKNMNKFQDTR
jgi:hypothetical protein